MKTVQVKGDFGSQIYHADIEPRQSIRLYGTYENHCRFDKALGKMVDDPVPFDLVFNVGSRAVYDSYNLTYVGTITAIGEKTVTIQHYPDRPKALTSLTR